MSATGPLSDRVFVVWPPVWNAFDPHVAVPALCGCLAAQGVEVKQFDLNIDFFRYVAAEKTIRQHVRNGMASLPRGVQASVEFARDYYRILNSPLQPGYQQRFSEDAEQQLLSKALAIFNHLHPGTEFTTLAVYHAGASDDSDFLAEFASRDAGNPYAAFYAETFIPALAAELPTLVGISICGSFQLGAAFTLARMVKQVDPRILVVIGGAFFSTSPQMLVTPKTAANVFRHVDAVILNEGELPFLRLIRQVTAGSAPPPGPNVVLRGERTLRSEPLECLPPEQIAVPDFAPGVVERYFRPQRRLPVEVSRGCYWGKCAFCNLATGANERYRGIPVENVARAVRTVVERDGARSVMFSTLAMAPKILRGVAEWLLAERIQIPWSAWIRPEKSLTTEDFDLFRRAGCTSLSVTPESFNANTLSRMRKGTDVENMVRVMRGLKQAGLCGWINLIPGFPGERVEDFLSTVEVCRDLGLSGEFFPFALLKNSPIYADLESFGVVLKEDERLDLAVAVPYVFARDRSAPTGIDLIRMAARLYPGNVFADNPSAGYTFDFSRANAAAVRGD